MIKFEECQYSGYPARTKENVLKSDVTIAIATDFNTAGEKLTKRLCVENGKLYVHIDLNNTSLDPTRIARIVTKINQLGDKEIVVNFAGNGIYSLKQTQHDLFEWIAVLLRDITMHPQLEPKIVFVRSGGQTGIDEAGVKAAEHLNIPAMVLAPKGWQYRDVRHRDISDEKKFKERFL